MTLLHAPTQVLPSGPAVLARFSPCSGWSQPGPRLPQRTLTLHLSATSPNLLPVSKSRHFCAPSPLKKGRASQPKKTGRVGQLCQLARASLASTASELATSFSGVVTASPPTWQAALTATTAVFVVGLPALLSGLTLSGIATAYLLGALVWRSFGGQGFLVVVLYFLLGTAVTKVRIKEKEAEGIAEKRSGRRGPPSVLGSAAAAMACAVGALLQAGDLGAVELWLVGFVASFCTKLSDTVASEIGKAFGKTTYLVTTMSIVPRGTEGAVSVEGTLAGLLAAIALAAVTVAQAQVTLFQGAVCVLASQIANLFESYLGATAQGTAGLEWLNNDVVNILNISVGTTIAILATAASKALGF